MKRTIVIMLSALLTLCLFTGCRGTEGGQSGSGDAGSAGTETIVAGTAEVDFSKTDDEIFTDRDYETEYDDSGSILIQLNGSSAVASSDSVNISGTVITITENATHIISGTLDNGMIIVNTEKTAKLQLVFNGVNINSATSAPLYILQADKVFVTLAEGSENYLSNGGSFTAIDENNIDAALYSRDDITLNGSGSLTVTSPAGHGIVAKDDLVITGGTYTITSASHGIDANDSVRITGETSLTIDAGKDGIHSENTDDASLGFVNISAGTIKIEAEGDGISAGSYLQINDGDIDILAGGGSVNASSQSSGSWGGLMGGGSQSSASSDDSSSMKGLKAAAGILISAGKFDIDSADDAVHSNTSVTVNGGVFEIASGDDAFHADSDLTITAGTINITKSYEGLEALNVTVAGGDIKLVASDDGLNAAGGTDSSGSTGGRDGLFGGRGGAGGASSSSNGSIVISGGTLYINSSGDGIDANGTLTISGGHTTVVGPTQGDTATLDYDKSATITGGTFIGSGASGMAQTFSSSEQGVVAVSTGTQKAGTTITLTDKDGNTVISYAPELAFQIFIFSSPEIVSGASYTITVGGTSGTVTAR